MMFCAVLLGSNSGITVHLSVRIKSGIEPSLNTRLSARLSVCFMQAPNSKTIKHRKAELGVTVLQDWSNWCIGFHVRKQLCSSTS